MLINRLTYVLVVLGLALATATPQKAAAMHCNPNNPEPGDVLVSAPIMLWGQQVGEVVLHGLPYLASSRRRGVRRGRYPHAVWERGGPHRLLELRGN